jgi:uncharacterized protein
LSSARQLAFFPTLGLWAVLVAIFIAVAHFSGYGFSNGGRSFLATLLTLAFLLLIMLLFAAKDFAERIAAIAGPAAAWLLGVMLFFIFLIYALGTGSASLWRLAAAAAFIFLPLALLAAAQSAAPGSWHDLFTLTAVWVAVKFGPSHWLWPYPSARLAYIFTVILAVNTALAGFLLLRRTKNVGYSVAWGANWSLYILGALSIFAAIAIPLALKLHFLSFAAHWHEWKSFFPLSIAILFFTAWPEEFLFRGLLQNLISRATNSDSAGWIAASILFGFSHITNLHFPNWRYVLLASIAGLFYGWTWRKTNSIFASALVHAGVDILWHFLFITT